MKQQRKSSVSLIKDISQLISSKLNYEILTTSIDIQKIPSVHAKPEGELAVRFPLQMEALFFSCLLHLAACQLRQPARAKFSAFFRECI